MDIKCHVCNEPTFTGHACSMWTSGKRADVKNMKMVYLCDTCKLEPHSLDIEPKCNVCGGASVCSYIKDGPDKCPCCFHFVMGSIFIHKVMCSETCCQRHKTQTAMQMNIPPYRNTPVEAGEFTRLDQCSHCRKISDKMSRCGRCKKVCYCGVDCQRSAWPSHKLVCGK